MGRKKATAAITLFFLISTAGAFQIYGPSLDVDIETEEKLNPEDSEMLEGFNYSVKNLEERDIRPRFYLIGPRHKGQVRMFTENKSVESGETGYFEGLLDEDREMIPPGGSYILIVEDQRTGDYHTEIISFNKKNLLEKNPYFVKTPYYPFHWKGSIFGNGNYSLNFEDKGLNGSFNNCQDNCGFSYRDSYKPAERLVIEGVSYNTGPDSELYAEIEGQKFYLEPQINNEGIGEFERTINLTKELRAHSKEEIEYKIVYKPGMSEFNWVQVNRYDFFNP